jgi:sulfite reductase (NADPH) flavoprotein alpha-component
MSVESLAKSIPYVPSSAPFSVEQRAWLNGFLAGLFADANVGEPGELQKKAAALSLLVMFGSQTGTAERLAKQFAKDATGRGFAPRVLELNAINTIDLGKEERLIIVTSTWGDGDPPDNAVACWNYLNSSDAPKLDHLRYAVLGLGDKNYSDFCGAGKKFDTCLEQLGAKRIQPLAECDLDYEPTAKAWFEKVWAPLSDGAALLSVPAQSPVHPAEPAVTGFHRGNPFPARLITNRKLNGPGSAKDTRHFEISLEGSGLAYEVGDALGVMPTNCPALVNDLLQALGCDGEEAVTNPQGKEVSLRNALLQGYHITHIPTTLLEVFAQKSGDTNMRELLLPERKPDLERYLYGREIIDFFHQFPNVKLEPAEFVAALRKLQPRLYSISSSPKAHPGEVHLTVAVVRYESHGRERKGVCSTFLADRVKNTIQVPVFVQTSHGFRLPQDTERPIIMIGPGTGIAPFRAFLEERRAIGARGRNWLFFGDQQHACDFLYREELDGMLADKTLTRLDTAFSRDQKEKIYVQNRMLENAGTLWQWLEEGAHLYVCGDAKRMARDVDAALHEVIKSSGGRNSDQAAEYVQKLKSEKRYQRDVY